MADSDDIRLKLTDDFVVTVSDAKIELLASSGAKVLLDRAGITLTDGMGAKIELKGGNITLTGTVIDMNSGALKVT